MSKVKVYVPPTARFLTLPERHKIKLSPPKRELLGMVREMLREKFPQHEIEMTEQPGMMVYSEDVKAEMAIAQALQDVIHEWVAQIGKE